MEDCPACLHPPFDFRQFESQNVGVDAQMGRFGQVTVASCRQCGRLWLCYLLENEGFSRSGRWYRGQIEPALLPQITAENAVGLLQQLPWYFYGGSYFNSAGRKGYPPLHIG